MLLRATDGLELGARGAQEDSALGAMEVAQLPGLGAMLISSPSSQPEPIYSQIRVSWL